MKLIKCEGEITTINGRSFRKPCVGEVIPKGHLRRTMSGNVYITGGGVAHLGGPDLVEVPTPIGESFESHCEWWQEIEPCLLDRGTRVLMFYDDGTKSAFNISQKHWMVIGHNLAIPCDAPEIATRPMTWGEAWDRDLWVSGCAGIVSHSKSFSERNSDNVDAGHLVSKSHRGPWYPAVMPWEGEK